MPVPLPLQAVIFDRDGVLIHDTHFPIRPGDLRWMPGAIELVASLNRQGVKVGVATNQSGVARGYFDEDAVQRFHDLMQDQLEPHKARVDRFEYCPHHPSEGATPYRTQCACRKPEPGMLLSLAGSLGVDPSNALVIGDRPSDLEAAKRAGMAAMHFTGGNLMQAVQQSGWLGRIG
jgi:D-glycero-D-manno-heptose 1,7-bisphosphate phosphatase